MVDLRHESGAIERNAPIKQGTPSGPLNSRHELASAVIHGWGRPGLLAALWLLLGQFRDWIGSRGVVGSRSSGADYKGERCGIQPFGSTGSVQRCDLPKGHDGLHATFYGQEAE